MISKIQSQKIKKAITKKEYVFLFFLWCCLFLLLNIYINELYIIRELLFTYPYYIVFPFLFFTTINTLLAALCINLVIIKYHEVKTLSATDSVLGTFGAFCTLLAGACPGCIAGFFPILMGIIGLNITLVQLPLYGIEIQILSMIILLIGAYYASLPMTCSTSIKHKRKEKSNNKNNKMN